MVTLRVTTVLPSKPQIYETRELGSNLCINLLLELKEGVQLAH